MDSDILTIFVAVLMGMMCGAGVIAVLVVAYMRLVAPGGQTERPTAMSAPVPPPWDTPIASEARTELAQDDLGFPPTPPMPMASSAASTPNPAPPPPDMYRTLDNVPAPKTGYPWLEGIGGMIAGQRIMLSREENVMGRSRVCDIQFHDPKVSRQHAMIRLYQGRYFIQDMESSRGTLVNSQPVRNHLLEDGDQIRLGDTVLVFHVAQTD